jgi:hypothetical protein
MTQTSTPNNSPTNSAAKQAIIKNWKTTVIGFIIAFAGFVTFSPATFGGENALLVRVCKYITLGGLAGLGVTAKDFNVTGGSQSQ